MINDKSENGTPVKRTKAKKIVEEKRKRFGQLIKSLRQTAQLTQHDVAVHLDYKYLSFVSQLETGKQRIPPQDIKSFALLYGVDIHAFAKECVRAYESENYFKCIYKETDRGNDLIR